MGRPASPVLPKLNFSLKTNICLKISEWLCGRRYEPKQTHLLPILVKDPFVTGPGGRAALDRRNMPMIHDLNTKNQ